MILLFLFLHVVFVAQSAKPKKLPTYLSSNLNLSNNPFYDMIARQESFVLDTWLVMFYASFFTDFHRIIVIIG
jgi:hypothetical protein